MSLVVLADMQDQLILHEGLKLTPYLDTAKPPKWTLGVGYNGTDRGWLTFEHVIGRSLGRPFDPRGVVVTHDEAVKVLTFDIEHFESALLRQFPTYLKLDAIRKRVVLDMAFNLGQRLSKFTESRAAVEKAAVTNRPDDWAIAAKDILESTWATQVKTRAQRLHDMMLTGRDYRKT